MRFVGATALLILLGACTQAPQNQAVAPAKLPFEHVQLKFGKLGSFSEVLLDVQYSPEGLADKMANSMASLVASTLKFCRPSEGPIEAAFRLDRGNISEVSSSSSPPLTRCLLRNLEATRFPLSLAGVHVIFRLSGTESLASR